MIMNSWCDFLI